MNVFNSLRIQELKIIHNFCDFIFKRLIYLKNLRQRFQYIRSVILISYIIKNQLLNPICQDNVGKAIF